MDIVDFRSCWNIAKRNNEIPPEVWKTRKFNNILLQYCNTAYNQNTVDRWTKGCILPFPKKGDLGIAKNYWGITLTSIVAKIYNVLLFNRIEPEIERIFWKKQNGFHRNRSTSSQILTIHQISESDCAKNLKDTLLFVNFFKVFDYTLREDEPNTSSLWSTQGECCSHNNAL